MLTRCGGQLRVAGMGGVTGLDLGVALRVGQALGYDDRALALLLPAVEAGAVAALNRKDEDD